MSRTSASVKRAIITDIDGLPPGWFCDSSIVMRRRSSSTSDIHDDDHPHEAPPLRFVVFAQGNSGTHTIFHAICKLECRLHYGIGCDGGAESGRWTIKSVVNGSHDFRASMPSRGVWESFASQQSPRQSDGSIDIHALMDLYHYAEHPVVPKKLTLRSWSSRVIAALRKAAADHRMEAVAVVVVVRMKRTMLLLLRRTSR